MTLVNQLKDILYKLYNYHKCLYYLENPYYINQPNIVDIHKTYNLEEPDIYNVLNMFHIENNYINQNTIIPFGILSNRPSIYRNHTILSFLHPSNNHLSNLYSTPHQNINFISKWTYNLTTINNDNTINTTIIITPPQNVSIWSTHIKDTNMESFLIFNNKIFNEFKRIIQDVNQLSNYHTIIITTSMWNKFAEYIQSFNKYILRIILDDFHLLTEYKALPIKYKFLWIVSDTMTDLLKQNRQNVIWKDDFASTCINNYPTIDYYLEMINTIYRNQYSYLNEDYINTIGSDKDFIIYNFEKIIENIGNRQFFNWDTPYNIFDRPYYDKKYKLNNVFFKDIFMSILQSSYELKLYDKITSFKSIITKNYTYLIDVIHCLPIYCANARYTFLNTNINNKETYTYYFDCHNNIDSLLSAKQKELENNKISSNEYNRICNINNNNNNCPVCFNNLNDGLFLTSCCKNYIHYRCIFSCFNSLMICPLCKLDIQFIRSSIVDSSLTNIIKLPSYIKLVNDLVKQDYKYTLMIINGTDEEYFCINNNFKKIENSDIDVILLSKNIQSVIRINKNIKLQKKW